ncbi:MAG: hypothetical protein IJT26_07185 [Bacteroidales bacterium]|nr:hypothetical protein [Bacteroidales bacterium]
MKRLFLAAFSAALLLVPFVSRAQAAEVDEEEGNHMTVTIAPRLEGNYGRWEADNQPGTNRSLGSSMLYMIMDGNITDNLSLYGAFQLLNPDPAGLYGKDDDGVSVLFNPQYVNFLNMLMLTYSIGNVDISLGKDALAFGGFEQDPAIVDTYWDIYSNNWNLVQPYLWGGRITWNIGDQAPFFQIVDSPMKERVFGKGGMCFFGGWNGQFYDGWETMWSFGGMQTPEDGTMKILSLGNRWTSGNLVLTLDYMARSFDIKTLFNDEMTLTGEIRYTFPKIDLFSKCGWEFVRGEGGSYFAIGGDDWYIPYGGTNSKSLVMPTIVPDCIGAEFGGIPDKGDYLFASLGAEIYPLKTRDLRIHVIGAMNNYNKSMSLTAGVTYYFNFNLW